MSTIFCRFSVAELLNYILFAAVQGTTFFWALDLVTLSCYTTKRNPVLQLISWRSSPTSEPGLVPDTGRSLQYSKSPNLPGLLEERN